MFGWFSAAAAWASARKRRRNDSSWARAAWSTLTATRRRRLTSSPRKTCADAPATPPRDQAIGVVYPGVGAFVERQTQVYYELDPSYDGVLQINGVEIPEDQVDRLSTGRTRIGFTPGPGKELSRFPPARNC